MIFERKLTFIPTLTNGPQTEQLVELKIGTPYFPAKSPGMEMFHACPVQMDASMQPHETIGLDAMQAMGNALASIHICLGGFAARGKLYWQDGRIYDHEHESPVPLEKQLSIVHLQNDIKFE